MAIICTDQDFLEGARKFRSEILFAPVKSLMETLAKIATFRSDVRYEEKVFSMDADLEFGNYNSSRTADLDVTVNSRVLKTYFASARREFDPNEYVHTIFSDPITKGEGLTGVQVARIVLNILSGKLGDNLRKKIFSAAHTDAGTDSATLFDGWDTVTSKEITGGGIAAGKGNYHEFTEAITATNAVDMIKEFVRAADDYLIDKPEVNLIMPYDIYYKYLDDYKSTTGAIPYNREYKQYYVEGFENVKLVPMGEKKGSNYLHLSTKDNMLVGFGRNGEEGSLVVEKHDVVKLTYFATMFFGVDFLSIGKDRLMVGKLKTA